MTTSSNDRLPSDDRRRMTDRPPTLEEALADNETLRQAVERLTTSQQALEEELRDARAGEALGRRAAAVAHGFKNVLTVIVGHGNLLLGARGLDDRGRRHAEHIVRAAEWGVTLTRGLMTVSRHVEPLARPVDLNAVVLMVTGLLRPVLGEGIEVSTRLDPRAGPVAFGPGEAEQVVMNLLLNARDAMPDGGRLTVTTDAAEGDGAGGGPSAVLTVTDTGAGIDPAIVSRLFEPYVTTKAPGQGTGLGLATVFDIVARNGGHVAVTSDPGRGATFTLRLPAASAPGPPAPPAPNEGDRAGAGTVLVVEEGDGVRELIGDVLRAESFAVLEARDAAAARAVTEAHGGEIDLLIVDVAMPGTAETLVEQLTAARPRLRTLYLTGHFDPAPGVPGRPPARVLQKPFTVDGLTRAVREALEWPPRLPVRR